MGPKHTLSRQSAGTFCDLAPVLTGNLFTRTSSWLPVVALKAALRQRRELKGTFF